LFHHEHCITKIVQTEEDLIELRNKMIRAKYYFFDTEASGLRVRHQGEVLITGFTIAFEDEIDTRVFYVPLRHEFEGVYDPAHITEELMSKLNLKPNDFPSFDIDSQDELVAGGHYWENVDEELFLFYCKGELESGSHHLIAHNISFDLHVLANMGIKINKLIPTNNYDDTMVMNHTFNEEAEKKLEKIIEKIYGIKKVDYNDVVATVTNDEKKSLGLSASKKATFPLVQIPIGAQYSSEDVWYMKNHYPDIIESLKEDEQWDLYRKLRIPFLRSLWKMERRGIKIDLVKIKDMEVKAKIELDKMKYDMFEIIGDCEINLNSGQQMAELLYGHKKKMKDKANGGYKESFNEKYIALSFGFAVTHLTEGGKDKDKNLKAPQVNEDSLKEILKKEYTKGKDSRKLEGQKFVRILLKYNRLKKLNEGFILGIQEQIYKDGRVHPSFNQCGTESWRLSCSEPNIQQLPKPLEVPRKPKEIDDKEALKEMLIWYSKQMDEYNYWHVFEIRDLFIPDNGEDEVIISADYSNLEKRITAHMTEDEALVELLLNGYDMHGFVAKMIFAEELEGIHPNDVKKFRPDLRDIAKTVGFAIDYGGTEFTVAKNLDIEKSQARIYIDNYFEGFAQLADWGNNQKRFGRKYGYVQTILGHKRHVTGIRDDNMRIKSYYERICLNAPIQGSASDIVSLAQIAIDKDATLRLLGCSLRMQIHDELVAVVPRKYVHICMERIQYHMSHCLPQELIVPLFANADYGNTYAEAK